MDPYPLDGKDPGKMSSSPGIDNSPAKIPVKSSGVDVWRVSLDAEKNSLDSLQQILSEDELIKATRLKSLKTRNHCIASRGFLRLIVAPYLDVKPTELRFQYGPHGKPALAEKFLNSGICFNVSHSHGLALYAVASGSMVGVDIEKILPDLAYAQMAARYFSPKEMETLQKLPPDQQREGFFNCWTRKEAYLKARGYGLDFPPDRFSVSLVPGEPTVLLDHTSDPREVSMWSIEDLDPGPGYSAGLAVLNRQAEKSRPDMAQTPVVQ